VQLDRAATGAVASSVVSLMEIRKKIDAYKMLHHEVCGRN